MHEAKENESKPVTFLEVEFSEAESITARNDYEEWLNFVANGGHENHDNATLVQNN